MAEKSQIKSGVILSYITLLLSTLIPFFYTPVMLRMLGRAEYGLYSLSNSTVSYLSLLTFGFGTTIIRYIAKYRAEGEVEKERKTFGFFLIIYTILAAIVMAIGIGIAFNVNTIFAKGLEPNELAKMKTLVLIMSFNCAISFPISVFTAVINAYERFVFRKLLDMILTIVAPAANLVALFLGFYSVGMAVAATVVQIITIPLSVGYCIGKIKLKPKFGFISRSLFREMMSFTFFVFIGSIVDMLFWATDKVILGMLASSVAVAVYNVGATFNTMVTSFSTAITGVLMPKITAMHVNDAEPKELTDLFIKVGRIQYILIALIVSGFTVFGRQFIVLWAGEDYVQAYYVAILTLFPLCIPLIQNTGYTILVAKNKHAFRSIVYLIIAIANVISTYILVPYMGLVGAALCSCVSYLLGQGLIMNIYYKKVLKLDIVRFWLNILRMSIIPALLLVLGLVFTHFVGITNWLTFFASVIVYAAVYTIGMFLFAFNKYEKDLVTKPIKKILGKIKHA